jgi:hypothetical protein
MRIFADHTVRADGSPYNWSSESHLGLNFFENFALDPRHLWISWLANRLGVREGSIAAANWSYDYHEVDYGHHADVIVCWQDDGGEAAIAIAAKRPGALKSSPLRSKDDPLEGHYLKYTAMRDIARRKQLLIVAADDWIQLPPHLRASRQAVTWEEIGAVQRAILTAYPSGSPEEFHRELRAHHAFLGIARISPENLQIPPQSNNADQFRRVASWRDGFDVYRHCRKGISIAAPYDWLLEELPMQELLNLKKLGPADWHDPLWRIANG